MSRHPSTETFQMDLRSSPQNLEPSRSSSIASQPDEMEARNHSGRMKDKSHKLDLYSIPVFLLEVLVLLALAYFAQFIHFQYQHKPLISGFYCDDISYRQQFVETKLTKLFSNQQNELTVVVLLLIIPIVLIIFCELVNSMFGSLKFRQIRALCTCCKLHSITRRSIRFSGAYVLGFLIVMISCDILATSTGRLRPYFAQQCPSAYQNCPNLQAQQGRGLTPAPSTLVASIAEATAQPLPLPTNLSEFNSAFGNQSESINVQPSSPPISSGPSSFAVSKPAASPIAARLVQVNDQLIGSNPSEGSRIRQFVTRQATLLERQWVDLSGQDIESICTFAPSESSSEDGIRKFNQIAMSWPSFPATLAIYACLYVSCYLCFVGTARPFRIITCVLVTIILLGATVFGVQLVKDHYHHWDDIAASAILALVGVIFVLYVYLNKFKDTHYYENQKLFRTGSNKFPYSQDGYTNYIGEGLAGQYNADKNNSFAGPNTNGALQNGETGGTLSNNDLAMRYFQIPRANYRGAPRPLSSLNQMRS